MIVCAVTAGLLFGASHVHAEKILWPGNGHWYEAVNTGTSVTWSEARDAADSRGGYLASIGSAAENDFVFSLIDEDEFWVFGEPPLVSAAWGPYLGGYQIPGSTEPGGGWTWLSGEPWEYTNWDGGQPDNNVGIEHYLQFHSVDGVKASTWNDWGWREYDPDPNPHAYVIEFEVIPEPSTVILLLTGALGLLFYRLRRT